MGILSSLFKFLKKWWWLILLIIIVIWIFFPVAWVAMSSFFSTIWGSISAFVGKYGLFKALALGFGLVAVIDPEAAKDIVDNVGEVAEHVVETGTDVLGSALSSPLLWIGGGLFLLWFINRKKKDPERDYAGDPEVTYVQTGS